MSAQFRVETTIRQRLQMHNVLITTFPHDWDAREIVSFLESRNCDVSVHFREFSMTEGRPYRDA